MTENDKRLNVILGKVADDIYADGQIGFKMLREDWEEIKPVIYKAVESAYGSVHNNVLQHLRMQRLIDNYEQSGLIL